MKEKALIMRDLNSLPKIWVSWELGPPISQLAPVRQSLYQAIVGSSHPYCGCGGLGAEGSVNLQEKQEEEIITFSTKKITVH